MRHEVEELIALEDRSSCGLTNKKIRSTKSETISNDQNSKSKTKGNLI